MKPEECYSNMEINHDDVIDLLPRPWQYLPHTFATVLSDGKWKPFDYLILLSHVIVAALAKGNARITISVAPRHGKSEFISKWLPAWYLCNWPEKRVVLSSYEATFAASWGRKVRELVREHGPQFDTGVSDATGAAAYWETLQGGGMMTAGAGGPITGKGMDLGLIDDPHKNWREATSPTTLRAIQDWYESTFYTRLEPGGNICILHCLAEGSRVLSADGWKNIEDLKSGEVLWTYDGEKMVREPMKELVPQGEDDIFRVETVRKSVEGNARHPFLVIKKTGPRRDEWITEWKQLQDLRVGDYVLTLKSLPSSSGTHYRVPGTTRFMENDFLWLLGMMVGDGWVTEVDRNGGPNGNTKNSFCVCVARGVDEGVNEKICSLIEKYFGRRPTLTKFGYYRLDSNNAGNMLKNRAGIVGGAKGKRLAPWIFKLRPDGKREFLRGLFEADGCQRKTKATKPSRRYVPSWSYACANKALVKDVRELALTCGMRPSKIYVCRQTVQPPNSKAPIESTIYRTDVVDRHQRAELRTIFNGMKRTTFFQVRPEKITAIMPAGRRNVYDVVMAGKQENFIANGFIVHNTRWVEEDLIGWIMREKTDENWIHIRLPALAEENDILGRPIGQALCPERYDRAKLLKIKTAVGSRVWAGLYQQRPAAEEGNIWKREHVRYYKGAVPPIINFVIQSWDTGFKKTGESAYSVCQTWGVGPLGAILLHQWREMVEYPELEKQVTNQYLMFRPNAILIEDRASGQSLIQSFQRNTNYPIIPVSVNNDAKVLRAIACSPMFESGRVWIPEQDVDHPWVGEMVNNWATFPNAVYADETDCASQALSYILSLAAMGNVSSGIKRKAPGLLEGFSSDFPSIRYRR